MVGRGRRREPEARRPALVSGRHATARLHGPHLCPCPPRAAAGQRPAPLERRRRAARPGPVWRRPAGQPDRGRGRFCQRFHTLPERASRAASEPTTRALAEQAMQGTVGGSSAGGEQPKFCTITRRAARDGQVLARWRFTDRPAHPRPAGVRTSGAANLAAAGLPAAQTQLFTVAGRVFLESVRFDRTCAWPEQPARLGRIGMVSLQVYDAEYVGEMDNWAATAKRMEARGLLTRADARHLRFLEAFGQLIANTDRHYGNISLLLRQQNGGDWTLSPTYDMLPMLYAPVGGELVAARLCRQKWRHS